MASPKRKWKVIFTVWREPVRGKFKGQYIERRQVLGRRTAAEAWALYFALRKRGHTHTLELWNWQKRIL